MQVMLASDVAKLYNSETKVINQVVKRNINRFPINFCFRLTLEEYMNLKSQIVTSKNQEDIEERNKVTHGGNRYLPYVFTEHGIMMLSGLLKSEIAAEVNVMIINAFVSMRKYISDNFLEQKHYSDMIIRHEFEIKKLQESFDKMQNEKVVNEIYFNGQIYDAYSKIIDIFKLANKEIIIIDGYADKIVLDMIRRIKVKVILIMNNQGLLTKLDIKKYNLQYDNLEIKYCDDFHDRYFIIDENIIYHCGSSVNHAGSKIFSINLLEDEIVKESLFKYVQKTLKN